MMPLRLLGSALSPAGRRAGLSILIFHRVIPVPDVLRRAVPDAQRFDTMLSWIASTFSVLPLDEAIGRLQSGRLPARALSITFDDGYADNHTVALPILQRHRMNATFFVASDFLDGGRMWNDTVVEAVRRVEGPDLDLEAIGLGRHRIGMPLERRRVIHGLLQQIKYLPAPERAAKVAQVAEACKVALPDDLMMTSEQLRALRAAGMLIGGHTRSHPILARVDDDTARAEIVGGKQRLEAILGEPITLFAYPNGKPGQDYLGQHAAMARAAGYTAAVSTSPGMARAGADPFQLPRFTPWDRTRWRFGLRLASNMRERGEIAA